jgi:hypothetical protein
VVLASRPHQLEYPRGNLGSRQHARLLRDDDRVAFQARIDDGFGRNVDATLTQVFL